jgi:hypothetical protein
MKVSMFAICIMSCFAAASADLIRNYILNSATMTYEFQQCGSNNDIHPLAIEGYDNFRSFISFPPGMTILDQRIRTGGREIGDDVNLIGYDGGSLNRCGTTLVNLSTENLLTRFQLTMRWYRQGDLQLLSSYTFVAGIAGGLPPNTGGLFFQRADFLTPLGITVEPNVYFTVQYSNIVGVSIDDIGQLYGGPINTGSSSRFIRDFTTGQMIDLGSDQQNLGLKIDFNPIPSPGPAALIALAAIIGTCRRR